MATVPVSHHRQPCPQQSPITTLFYTDERKSANTSVDDVDEENVDTPTTELFHTVLDFERIAHHTTNNNHQKSVIPSKLACDAAIEVEWWEPMMTGADVDVGAVGSSSPEGGITAAGEDTTANETTELQQRITNGANYVHNNNNNSNGMDANKCYKNEKEEGRIPSVRAVFCGYRYTADDYHRLKTAAEEEEDQQKQQQQQHPNTYEI